MCVLCRVYCAESITQAQRLQTRLCLHDINATMVSKKWKGSYDSGPKYRGKWRWLSHGCKKVLIDQHANCGIFLLIHMFVCDKGRAMPQVKFGFFLAFNQFVWLFSGLFLVLFGFLLKFSSGKHRAGCQMCERIVVLLVFNIYQSQPALASAGPDWKYFAEPHSVACAEIFEGGIKS